MKEHLPAGSAETARRFLAKYQPKSKALKEVDKAMEGVKITNKSRIDYWNAVKKEIKGK